MWRAIAIVVVLAGCKREAANALPAPGEQAGAPAAAPVPAASPGDDPHGQMPPGPVAPDQPLPAGHPAISGGSGDSSNMGAMPGMQPTPPTMPDKLADGRLRIGPFGVQPPAAWKLRPVTSSMRVADFMLPSAANQEAELVVYYFGDQGAGSVDSNIDRWLGQFAQADGKSSRDAAKIEHSQVAGQEATLVAVSGHYTAMAMPGASAAADTPDATLLAAIVSSPSGPYYFKLVGAKATVDAQAKQFRDMLSTMKLE